MLLLRCDFVLSASESGGEVKHVGAVGAEKKGDAIWMDEQVGEGVHCLT